MPMTLVEKTYVLLVSQEINIWDYPSKKEGPKFFYYLRSEPENLEGHGFETYEEMIDAAYAQIDPMMKTLPDLVEPPHAS